MEALPTRLPDRPSTIQSGQPKKCIIKIIMPIYEYKCESCGRHLERRQSVRLFNNQKNDETDFPTQGVFIAIGHKPNTEIFKGVLEMD
ncbi:MAG: hypothetical protein LC734_09365, partial [Acidobacteria bacterium]|nr:hypothetical protein [Acidobacteriota bacterium]